ncbi:MAG TPA: xanthine dehydrogenase family protein subunit M [Candidatus Binatia bacterium]|nr:xanthine dehydrogenase family protein subunit M [Candidatus Binatia bacterium]
MIPASFEYHAAKSVEDALALLGKYGDGAKLLAGGHSLIPALKLRLQSVEHLIDLGRISGLDSIREAGGKIAIGALTTHQAVESSELLRKKCPLLAECAGHIGDVQVRNRGTIGGSLSHADPAADYPAAVLALEAEIEATSAKGKRTIGADGFFVDMLTTALQPGEIVTEIRVPVQAASTGGAYLKVAQPASGFAIVGVAALVTLDGSGKCSRVRVGVTGAAVKGYRAKETEAELGGKAPDDATLARAAERATNGVETSGDIFASPEYRAHLTRVYTRRALAAAVARARKGA